MEAFGAGLKLRRSGGWVASSAAGATLSVAWFVVDAFAEGVEADLYVGGGDVLAVVVFGEQSGTEEYRNA